jgi:DNA polymerase III alpha subunit
MPRTYSVTVTKKSDPLPSHICMLAMTNQGLSNLWALSTIAYTEKHFYHKPIATPDLMRSYSEGIYASDGCMLTQFADAIVADNEDAAKAQIGTLLDIYKERFYMELHTWQYVNPGEDQIKWDGELDHHRLQANAQDEQGQPGQGADCQLSWVCPWWWSTTLTMPSPSSG